MTEHNQSDPKHKRLFIGRNGESLPLDERPVSPELQEAAARAAPSLPEATARMRELLDTLPRLKIPGAATADVVADSLRRSIAERYEQLELARSQAAAIERMAGRLDRLTARLEQVDRERQAEQARLAVLESEVQKLKKPGRPSSWPLVLEEFDRRAATRNLGRSRNATARALAAWLKATHRRELAPDTIANHLSKERRDAPYGDRAGRKGRHSRP